MDKMDILNKYSPLSTDCSKIQKYSPFTFYRFQNFNQLLIYDFNLNYYYINLKKT